HKPYHEAAPARFHDTLGLARQPRLRLGLLHQDVIERQHQAALDFLDHPGRRLQAAAKPLEQGVEKWEGGLCCHSPPLFMMTDDGKQPSSVKRSASLQ